MIRKARHRDMSEIIGANMRRFRMAANFTQEQLAEKVELTSNQILRYESGDAHISMPTLYDLSAALNCSYQSFYQGIK